MSYHTGSATSSGTENNSETQTAPEQESTQATAQPGSPTHRTFGDTNTYSSPDPNSIPTGIIPANTEIRAIEFDLGEGFVFGLFATEDGTEFYILEEDLQLLGATIPRIKPKIVDKVVNYNVPASYEDAIANFPFYKDGRYHVKLDTGMFDIDMVHASEKDFRILAIVETMDYYGKVRVDSQLFELEAMIGFLKTEAIITPERAGQPIKIAFSIREEYLDALEDRSIEVIENLYSSIIAVHFPVKELPKIVKQVSNRLKKYAMLIDAFDGHVEGVDMPKLSDKMHRFYGEFKKMLQVNGIVLENLSSDSKIEFGFNPQTYRLEYAILYESPGKFLTVGVNKFSQSIDSNLAKLIMSSRDIVDSIGAGENWQQFLSDYFGGDFKINFSKPETGLGLQSSLSDLESEYDKYKKQFEAPFKTAEESLRNMQILDSEEFKTVAGQYVDRARDQIGDNFLKNLPEIIENINDLESLYQLVFDKVSVEDLTNMIMAKAAEELGVKDLNEIKARAILKKLEAEKAIDLIFDGLREQDIKVILQEICRSYDFQFMIVTEI